MTYTETIRQLTSSKIATGMNPRKRTYWPRFAFHFTDINNAVSILKHRCLVSRNRAIAQGWMSNDNASQSVISTTSSVVENQVRLYFRPRTPTQFHNEGFKTKLARNDGRVSANCPIPVFFLFDLSQVLALSNSKFSMMTLATAEHGKLMNTPEEFAKLPFADIYHDSAIVGERKISCVNA